MTAPQPQPLPRKVRYVRNLEQVSGLDAAERRELEAVAQRYAFRANDYYLGLIDWNDPEDPIRRLVIPHRDELVDWGDLDASNEAANTVARGVQHKYADTALVLAAATCAAYCRYCFRKRLFMDANDETTSRLDEACAYIERHGEITNVLLTGGDPLVLSTDRLSAILERFAAMPHVRVIRLGSKTIAFNPFRLTHDPDLLAAIRRTVRGGTAVYLMAHFDHPRELTTEARDAVAAVQQAGGHVVNQCPLIRGVNDDADVLAELFTTMTELGAPQYYLFQGRPTAGNEPYHLPLVTGWKLFDRARRRCSGLSRRVRFCMSHEAGKIEVVGLDRRHIFCRYHRARDRRNESRMIVCHRDDDALWLDDLDPIGRAAVGC